MFKKIGFSIFAFLLISTGALAQMAPDELVRQSTQDILAAIKADKDIQGGDIRKLEKLAEEKILPHFNFQRMTQLAIGRNWRDASDAQKTALTEQFRTLLVRTYSKSLMQYRNQVVEVKPAKVDAADTEVLVKTLVLQQGGPSIPIDYTLEKSTPNWRVVDVLIDGVSLVTNYRTSFNAEIKSNGIDGLITSLTDRNNKNAAKR